MSKTAARRCARLHGMATIRKEILIDAPPADVWDALADFGALHERLVPGFVTDTQMDGEDRIVTFFNGAVVRELFVDCDPDARRLVWSVVGGPYTHHNASAQVFEQDGATRFAWTADFLPHDVAEVAGQLMDRGLAAIKQTLERTAVS